MRKIAIVTGASSGIGEAYLRLIASGESELEEIWAIARRGDRLDALKSILGDKIVPVVCDLSVESDIEKLASKIEETSPDIRILVNCAGIGFRSLTKDLPTEKISSVVEVNCLALTKIISICLKHMNSGSGIINVASTAGFLPQKGFASYSASKAFVINFSRALFYELKPLEIGVTCVCPGPVNTEFQKLATGMDEFTGFRKKIAADPVDLALKSYKAFKKGRSLYCHGFTQKMFHIACKIIPIGLLERFVKD